uniref:hypothetical protein n=1 Tax=Anaplasma marginale TaxID=770 RepID=UPI0005B43D4A
MIKIGTNIEKQPTPSPKQPRDNYLPPNFGIINFTYCSFALSKLTPIEENNLKKTRFCLLGKSIEIKGQTYERKLYILKKDKREN